MGAAEGFSSGDVVVKEIRRGIEGSCSSGAQKEKTQLAAKQKNSSNCRRGDKRNSKIHKNRCDSFSLKNGVVGFSAVGGGNDFFGLYGLKPDAFDITKYVNELSVDELLHGSYSCPVSVEKEKKPTKSNSNLLQSVRKACSVLQAYKGLRTQKSAAIDDSCIQKISTGLVNSSSAASQTDGDKGDTCSADLPALDKVQESDEKDKTLPGANSPLYQPKDILQRLALPPPKDLDLLLSDARTTSSKNSIDPRLGKIVPQRTGLPPFPWSHSFSGHNKLVADAVKLSTNRTACQGRWVKVSNSAFLQKGSANLLVDFESLTFNETLIPKVNLVPEHAIDAVSIEQILSSSGVCSTMILPADEPSPTHIAAQTLCDLATCSSRENFSASVQLQNKPSQISMKPFKTKAIEKSDKLFDAPKSTIRTHRAIQAGNNGFPSKKPRLSPDVTNVYNKNSDSSGRGPLNISAPAPKSFKPPPRKLFNDSNTSTDNYSFNFLKTSYMMKPPRAVDRPSGSQQKLMKVPMKWSRPES